MGKEEALTPRDVWAAWRSLLNQTGMSVHGVPSGYASKLAHELLDVCYPGSVEFPLRFVLVPRYPIGKRYASALFAARGLMPACYESAEESTRLLLDVMHRVLAIGHVRMRLTSFDDPNALNRDCLFIAGFYIKAYGIEGLHGYLESQSKRRFKVEGAENSFVVKQPRQVAAIALLARSSLSLEDLLRKVDLLKDSPPKYEMSEVNLEPLATLINSSISLPALT